MSPLPHASPPAPPGADARRNSVREEGSAHVSKRDIAHLRSRRGGFTIFELTVLLVILAMIASFGIPAYFGRPAVTLDSAAKLMARDLREVQNRAALYEETLVVRFTEGGSGYRVTDASGQALLSPYGNGPFVRAYESDAVFRGVKITAVETRRGPQIGFDAGGRPQSSARVVLEFGGERRTVILRAGSGLIAIEGLDENWVDLGL